MTNRKILLTAAIAAVVGSVQAADLKTDADKVGYALGVDMGTTVKEIGTKNINLDAIVAGLKDAAEGKELAMKREEMDQTMKSFAEARMKEMQAQFEKEIAANAEAGKKFLDENGKKDGVKTTATGLQYKVEKEGKGAKPTKSDSVTVHYEGRLLDGTVEGLQLMSEGSKYTLYIPSTLAYGETGAPPSIPPNATLTFDVELIKVGEAAKAEEKPADAKADAKPEEAKKEEAKK